MAATREDVERCYKRWFDVLPKICKIESPWCFLCLAALIDYLASAAYHKRYPDEQWKRYTKFIENYFPAPYKDFTYPKGQKDLPRQMYQVLRNGLVHSFSLFPNKKGKKHKARPRSIVLGHRSNSEGHPHLSKHVSTQAPNAVRFVAEDFLEDTQQAANSLLNNAPPGSATEKTILVWFTAHPPIQWTEET